MFEYGADIGKIAKKIREHYLELADGDAGLVITGMRAISVSTGVGPIMVSTEYDGYIADLREIANAVHAKGGKIMAHMAIQGAGFA